MNLPQSANVEGAFAGDGFSTIEVMVPSSRETIP